MCCNLCVILKESSTLNHIKYVYICNDLIVYSPNLLVAAGFFFITSVRNQQLSGTLKSQVITGVIAGVVTVVFNRRQNVNNLKPSAHCTTFKISKSLTVSHYMA